MYDFRNIMFGLENTVLLDVETWKKESHHHPHSLWNSDLDESDLEEFAPSGINKSRSN